MSQLPADKVRVSDVAVLSLDGAITYNQTSLTVAGDPTGWPTSDFEVAIEDELIHVGTRSGLTLSNLTRGYEGTDDTHHNNHVEVAYVKSGAELAQGGPGGSFDGGTVHHTIQIDPDGSDEPSIKIGESTEPPTDASHTQLYTDAGDGKLKAKLEDDTVVDLTAESGGSVPHAIAVFTFPDDGSTDDTWGSDGDIALLLDTGTFIQKAGGTWA